jgi:hypothetical protein
VASTSRPPSVATDAVNKQYVDNAINGMSWKAAVQVATTTDAPLATAFTAGQVIDGYTLVTNDRILIKNQTSGGGSVDNGLYTVNPSGAPSRTADGATGELITNSTVRINYGTINGDSSWDTDHHRHHHRRHHRPELGAFRLRYPV